MAYMPVNDGIDHINIYSKGATELGRLLTNFAHTPVDLCSYGRFASIEGFWYYAKTGFQHEELRELHGARAKSKGREFEGCYFEGFEDLIKESLKCKLRQHPKILAMLIDSGTMPLTHYYYYGTPTNPKVTRLEEFDWITQVFRDAREVCIKKCYYPQGV